jgi:hypothetical protein
MGGLSNPIIAKGVEQLKESDLWKETAKKYPELSEDMLAKEVLAEAIGREGKNLFKEKEKQNKFMSWLSALFFKLKSKLGLEKNVAKKLAVELLSGKDLGLATVASGAVQQQKEAEEEQEEEEPKEKTKEERVKEIIDALRSQMIINWRTYAQRIEKTRGGEYKAEEITKRVNKLKHKIETTTGQEQIDAQLEYDYYTSNDDNYKKEFEQYQKEFEDVLKHYARMDFDLAPLEKMYEYYSTLKRYNVLATENIISELLDAMAARIGERGVEAIKAKNSQYNEALTSKEDIKKLDVFFKALSDMDERYPEMQELAREFNKAYTDSLEERQRFVQEVLDVEKKIIEDYNKLHGITGKIKDFLNPFEDNSKYYTFLLNPTGQVIKREISTITNLQKTNKGLLPFTIK